MGGVSARVSRLNARPVLLMLNLHLDEFIAPCACTSLEQRVCFVQCCVCSTGGVRQPCEVVEMKCKSNSQKVL